MDPWSPAKPDPDSSSSESLLELKFLASQTFSFETLVISPGIVGMCGQRHASSDRDMRSEPAPLWLTRHWVASIVAGFECDQGCGYAREVRMQYLLARAKIRAGDFLSLRSRRLGPHTGRLRRNAAQTKANATSDG